jgi:hypothetical protein
MVDRYAVCRPSDAGTSAVGQSAGVPSAMTPISSMAPLWTERPLRLRDVALPGWWRWAPQAVVVWALGYGSRRIYGALGQARAHITFPSGPEDMA